MSFADELASRSQQPVYYDFAASCAKDAYWDYTRGCKEAARQGKRSFSAYACHDDPDYIPGRPSSFAKRWGNGQVVPSDQDYWNDYLNKEVPIEQMSEFLSLLKSLIYSRLIEAGFRNIRVEPEYSENLYPYRENIFGRSVLDKKRPYQLLRLRISVEW